MSQEQNEMKFAQKTIFIEMFHPLLLLLLPFTFVFPLSRGLTKVIVFFTNMTIQGKLS